MKIKNVVFIVIFSSLIFCSCSVIPVTTENTQKPALLKSIPESSGKSDAHEGLASVYSDKFHGKKTASGLTFNQQNHTAASKEHQFGSRLKVTNKLNGKSTTVTVTDRGPFVKGRIIDLSKAAAREIEMPQDGLTYVKVEKID